MLMPIGTNSGLWEARQELRRGGFRLPTRMTVVRLADGALLLHSPIAIDAALAAELAALGPVRHLVAPNRFHHLFLAPAAARYPEASVFLAPGLAARLPALPGASELREKAAAAWSGELRLHVLAGAQRLGEAVFLHRPSATLLCSDLLFNVRHWDGPLTGLALACFGTRGRLAASRVLHLVVRDRARFRASIAAIAAWDFRRIVMGHGEVYESATARDDLLAALALRLGAGLGAKPGP